MLNIWQHSNWSESGLLEDDTKHILDAVHTLPEIEQLILFGSRAKGTYKSGSDVDLVVKGEQVTYDTVVKLSGLLSEEKPFVSQNWKSFTILSLVC